MYCGCKENLNETKIIFENDTAVKPIPSEYESKDEKKEWYVVMYVREKIKKTTKIKLSNETQRTSIQKTPSIIDVIRFGRSLPKKTPKSKKNITKQISTQNVPCSSIQNKPKTMDPKAWNLIAVLGPLSSSSEADIVYMMWSKNVRNSVRYKIARAEAISKFLLIPSYLDLNNIFHLNNI